AGVEGPLMAESGDAADHVQVAETGQAYEAELIALRLRGEGIDAHVVDQTFHQEPISSVRSFAVVRVFVPRDREAEARQILAHPHGLPEDAEPGSDETT